MAEIDLWGPAKFVPSTAIHVDTIDARQHPPAPLAVQIFVVGEQASNYARRIRPELLEMLRPERASGAHDVTPETECWSPFGREEVCLDRVGEVEPAIQVLVYLEIQILVLIPGVAIVVGFWKEPSSSQDDARQALGS